MLVFKQVHFSVRYVLELQCSGFRVGFLRLFKHCEGPQTLHVLLRVFFIFFKFRMTDLLDQHRVQLLMHRKRTIPRLERHARVDLLQRHRAKILREDVPPRLPRHYVVFGGHFFCEGAASGRRGYHENVLSM